MYLARKQDRMPKHKLAMDRVSLLFCSNATGVFKSKPVCIYRSACPRALKNVSDMESKHNSLDDEDQI